MNTKRCAGSEWRRRLSKPRLVAPVVVVLSLTGVGRVVTQSQAGGDAVTVWNANAGVAATAACLAPLNNPLHESRIYVLANAQMRPRPNV